MPAAKKKLVIFLHGWAQNAFVMKSRTAKLQKKLIKAGYECIYLEAPHLLPMTSTITIDGKEVQITNGQRENAKAWFTYSKIDSADASMALKETPMEYIGLDESIDRVKECLVQHCDNDGDDSFCGIIGFSQGATFCHILSMLASNATRTTNQNDTSNAPLAKIKCAIMLSGFPSMHNCNGDSSLLSPRADTEYEANINNKQQLDFKSLHIYGESDTSVPKSYGEKLANCFSHPEIYIHEKGHVIPHNAALCERVISFLDHASA